VRDNAFIHPKLGFAFDAPDGFTLDNQSAALIGVGEAGGEALRLDSVAIAESTPVASAIGSGWIDGVKTTAIEPKQIAGLEAATAVAQGQQWSFRLGAIRLNGRLYRLIFAAHALSPAVDSRFMASLDSFHLINAQDSALAAPQRIKIVEAGSGDTATENIWFPLREKLGATEFLGYEQLQAQSRILRVLKAADEEADQASADAARPTLEVFVERTPFYAESGGQVGDTGTIESETGTARVIDTDRPLEGIVRHRVRLESGTLMEGQEATLRVDADRREAIRRSHTATHLLHWALRSTFGSQLQQQGSLVEPDYLRFDFNHHAQLSDEEIARIEELVIGDILSDEPVQTTEETLAAARADGAMSFFGDKYGEIVRVVRAGEHSLELCGGTHVPALGRIGGFVVRGESSVGANLRRIEALTGKAAHADHRRARGLLHTAAESLHVAPDSLPEAIARLQTSLSQEERRRKALAAKADSQLASSLAESAVGGSVVARLDDRDQQALRAIAAELVARDGVDAVGLIGSPDGEAVALAVAFAGDSGDAPAVVRSVAKLLGGGGGGKDRRLAVGGGRDVAAIDAALAALRDAVNVPAGA